MRGLSPPRSGPPRPRAPLRYRHGLPPANGSNEGVGVRGAHPVLTTRPAAERPAAERFVGGAALRDARMAYTLLKSPSAELHVFRERVPPSRGHSRRSPPGAEKSQNRLPRCPAVTRRTRTLPAWTCTNGTGRPRPRCESSWTKPAYPRTRRRRVRRAVRLPQMDRAEAGGGPSTWMTQSGGCLTGGGCKTSRGCLDQLEKDHLGRVRAAWAELEDAGVAAVAVRVARRQLLEETL